MKDDQRSNAFVRFAPHRIGARDMACEHSIWLRLFVQIHRNVVCTQAIRAEGHQRGQGISANMRVHGRNALLLEVFWCVHGAFLFFKR